VGRQAEAKNSIRRTAVKGYYTEELLNAQVALIDHTHELEWQETKKGSLFNCFKGTNRRRLEIVCVVWSVQYWCGQPMTGYSTYLYVVIRNQMNPADAQLAKCWSLGQRCFQYEPW